MVDHIGFMADILENPTDDAPRLIYADWLEENGDSDRPEFIRLQCEQAKTPEYLDLGEGRMTGDPFHGVGLVKIGNSVWSKQQSRIYKLWLANSHIWGRLPGPLRKSANLFDWWRRGFVEKVVCSGVDWLRWSDAITTQPVQRVVLTTRPALRTHVVTGKDTPGWYPEAWERLLDDPTGERTLAALKERWPRIEFELAFLMEGQ